MSEFKEVIYSYLERDQELSTADKMIINQQINEFTEEYKEKTGEDPKDFAPVISFFAPRLQDYGFFIRIADYYSRVEMRACAKHTEDKCLKDLLYRQKYINFF